MSTVSKAMYKPLSIAMGVAGGMIASTIFDQVWERIGDSSEAPDPKDLSDSGRDVLLAAALQGLIFGLVRAAITRVGAHGYHAVTNENLE